MNDEELRDKLVKIIGTYGYDELPTEEATADAIMSLFARHTQQAVEAARTEELEKLVAIYHSHGSLDEARKWTTVQLFENLRNIRTSGEQKGHPTNEGGIDHE